MFIRALSTCTLWSLMGIIVYTTKEAGAMWILNLCSTLTLFEIYTILGRLGFAANRMSGLLTGGCMIPIAYYFPSSGIDVLAVGALLCLLPVFFFLKRSAGCM